MYYEKKVKSIQLKFLFTYQLCTHFANKGCRVFAGMLEPIESLPAKLLRGWINQRLNADVPMKGSIIPLQMDVTKEDVMREAAEAMGAHLNAGENGRKLFPLNINELCT